MSQEVKKKKGFTQKWRLLNLERYRNPAKQRTQKADVICSRGVLCLWNSWLKIQIKYLTTGMQKKENGCFIAREISFCHKCFWNRDPLGCLEVSCVRRQVLHFGLWNCWLESDVAEWLNWTVLCIFAFHRFTWATRECEGRWNYRHNSPALLERRYRQPQPSYSLFCPGEDSLLRGLANGHNR